MEASKKSSAPPTNYAEYLQTGEGERWEIIGGVPYNMTPAPSTEHQRIVGRLHTEFSVYLRGKKCESFVAPFDVRLFGDGKTDHEIENVVQPDLVIVCDPTKLDDRGCNGTPDLVVEVLSPATARKDRNQKLKLYRKAGVKEYWIVDPFHKTVEVYQFERNVFAEPETYGEHERVKVGIFEDLEINLEDIFGVSGI
ncbi:Uma2 family endonuclease [Effusibacillus pohliae]|uniref:Uma2 family endonuclease n=1 Tax=Effusibacillus pohliae TaxID=232270 RepID=UPI000361D677|nr:Uma2 family endonuclease [Effusibacillus pohliae]